MISFHILLLAVIASPVCGLSGAFSWKASYQGKMTRIFNMKIFLSIVYFIVVAGAFLWRVIVPDLVEMSPEAKVYGALLIAQLALVLVLGHYGGKIVFA